MRKLKFLLFFILFTTSYLQAQIVNIPDPYFKSALLNHGAVGAHIDTNDDGQIQVSEAEAITGIVYVGGDVFGGNITDLTGIEAFTNITALSCHENQLTSLDLSSNIALIELLCSYNNLTEIDISNNTNLTLFNCTYNSLTEIDISNNNLLTEFECVMNLLTEIDVSNLTNLNTFYCLHNQLTEIDVSNNTNLEHFRCGNNELTVLNIADNSTLRFLNCGNNNINILDLSNNLSLETLQCAHLNLTSLDISNNEMLDELVCSYNQLSELNINNNLSLSYLGCTNNQLIYVDVRNGNNTNFTFFHAEDNPNLTCIFVDDKNYCETHWTNIDPNSHFVETQAECDALQDVEEYINKGIEIYPNPTDGIFTINTQIANTQIDIIITDLLGKILYNNTINLNSDIDISYLPQGVYIVSIIDKKHKKLFTKKIIKI